MERLRARRAAIGPLGPAAREHINAARRHLRFLKRLKDWCTAAYLRKEQADDVRCEKALKRWLRACEIERKTSSVEYRAEISARKNAQVRDRYWRNPTYERLKTQAYKAANPAKKEKWQKERDKLIRTTTDGSVSRGLLLRMLVASHYCPYCHDPYFNSRKTTDHIVPLCRGGKHVATNITICCKDCNTRKGRMTADEFKVKRANS